MAAGGDDSEAVYMEALHKVEQCRDLLSGYSLENHLPQICVIGDQSAGKSTLLEAISGVKFPHGASTVTKCPTVVRMMPVKTEKDVVFKVGALSDEVRPVSADSVTSAISDAQSRILREEGAGFSPKHVTVEAHTMHPHRLVLVDLPGIVRTGDEKEIVRNMLLDKIKGEQVLILAVGEARTDEKLYEVLELAKEVDPDRIRTLFVHTKCDTAREGEPRDVIVKRIAQATTDGELGAHFVAVRDDSGGMLNTTDEESVLTGAFGHESPAFLGIDKLRARLEKLLRDRVLSNIGPLRKLLRKEQDLTYSRLHRMGAEPRNQHEVLLAACERLKDVLRKAWYATNRKLERLDKWVVRSKKHLFKSVATGSGEARTGDDSIKAVLEETFVYDIPPFFQGQEVVDTFIEQAVRFWESQARGMMREMFSMVEEQLVEACSVPEDAKQFQRALRTHVAAYVSSQRIAALDRLAACTAETSKYGTMNHYLLSKYWAQSVLSSKLLHEITTRVLSSAETAACFDGRRPTAETICTSLERGIHAEIEKEAKKSLIDHQVGIVKAVVLATWDVKKKVFLDRVLENLRDTFREMELSLTQLHRHDTLVRAAGEDDLVRLQREELVKKIDRLQKASTALGYEVVVKTHHSDDTILGTSSFVGGGGEGGGEGEDEGDEDEEGGGGGGGEGDGEKEKPRRRMRMIAALSKRPM